MLAPKGSLAVRADLHPAIQHLLLSAAVQIHSQPGVFQKAGQFPAAETIDVPLSEEAQRFYKTGRSFLQNQSSVLARDASRASDGRVHSLVAIIVPDIQVRSADI